MKKDQTNVNNNVTINPIKLTEDELVAFISLISGDIKSVPQDSNYEYNPGFHYKRRLGLDDNYPIEKIKEGIHCLEKRKLIVNKVGKLEIDDVLTCIVGVVVSGVRMADGTFYDKDTHISSNYLKNENGEYLFALVSRDIKAIHRSFPKISAKYICFATLLICLVSVGLYFKKFNQKDTFQISSPKPVEINLSALGDNKLAYVKNGDMFLADKSRIEQITSAHTVSNLKVSQDGKYLGWIEKNDFNIEDGTTRSAGYAISLVDLTTLEIIYDVISPLNFVSNNDISKKEITSFDYLTTNPLAIVYVNDGVWEKEFSTDKVTKLLDNYYGNIEHADDDRIYSNISINPQMDKLIIGSKVPNSCGLEIYDLKTLGVIRNSELNRYCYGNWLKDGKTLFAYKNFNVDSLGLIQVNVESKNNIKDFSYPVDDIVNNYGIDIVDENSLVAVLKHATKIDIGLYQIKLRGKTDARLIIENKNIAAKKPSIKSINQIGYLVHNAKNIEAYDLHSIDLGGQNGQVIVEGISEYVWIPENRVQETTWLDKTYTDYKYGLSFKHPLGFGLSNKSGFIFDLQNKTKSVSINGKILENTNDYDSIKEWYINYGHYTGWNEIEKDGSITEATYNSTNIISDRYVSAEGYFIIENFLLLKTGDVLSLSVVVDPKTKEQIDTGEKIYSPIINSIKLIN